MTKTGSKRDLIETAICMVVFVSTVIVMVFYEDWFGDSSAFTDGCIATFLWITTIHRVLADEWFWSRWGRND